MVDGLPEHDYILGQAIGGLKGMHGCHTRDSREAFLKGYSLRCQQDEQQQEECSDSLHWGKYL